MIPVVMTAYNRLSTLKKTLDSLFECDGFDKDRLSFYLDGGKNNKDWESLNAVHAYLEEINPNINMAAENLGLKANSLKAINHSLILYDKIIFIQDDQEFSKDFLTYMDWALNEFEDRQDIMFASGYSHIDFPTCYLSPLIADGLGIWREKFSYAENCRTIDYKGFAKATTPSFASYLRDIINGKSDAFMALLCYQMYMSNARCLHPGKNKVRYMVSDSTNCKQKDREKLNNKLYDETIVNESNLAYNIIRETKNYKWSKLKRFTRWLNTRVIH